MILRAPVVYAAFTEAVRYAVPEFVVGLLLLVVLPAITLALDALLHYLVRTPNLVAGVAASLAVSVLSSAFNWYSMRRGTLLVGPKARPFTSDVASLPILIARFLSEPFVLLWRALRFLCASAWRNSAWQSKLFTLRITGTSAPAELLPSTGN